MKYFWLVKCYVTLMHAFSLLSCLMKLDEDLCKNQVSGRFS